MSTPGRSEKAASAQPADERSMPQHLRCSSCSKPLFNAFQTPHGCRICQPCVQGKLHPTERRLCPGTTEACKDKDEEISISQASCYADIATRREVSKLTVFCPNRDDGCKEQMRWLEVDAHLENCDYEKVVSVHFSNECRQRKETCKLCGQSVVHSEMDKKTCLQEILEMKQYLKAYKNRLNKLLKAPCYDGLMPWTVSNFSKWLDCARRQTVTNIFSEPFYSSPNGFKFKVRLFPNGLNSGAGTHLSVHLVLVQRKDDSELDDARPLSASVSFKLIIGENRTDFKEKTVRFDPGLRRPSNRADLSVFCGEEKFISHNDLKRFLKHDKLHLVVEVRIDDD